MGCGKNNNNNDVAGIENNNKFHRNCVCEVVRAIKDIQDAAEEDCECPTNCFLEPLGALISPGRRANADTRVFILKTADGSPFHAFFRGSEHSCVSIFFRVEDIFDNCCAVLRVLEPLKFCPPTSNNANQLVTANITKDCCVDLDKVCDVDRFRSTNDCITVDLSCFCGVQCIADVNLRICED
ncbi:CotY/CotZ family spore coat protein [Bacillus sp. T33-2]|uniref:CotY/CotZ family spore coat protein n=1 Tax=Bacillus sp. T33-2 TaxID=2054168 RepID=UPI000C78CBC1|nr:CotY/CotZ family spore coat protein [Bacillus sp. T33-2]PLR97591.1 spore coat protein CotZ [Bacillus sp. T33-2]